SPLGRGVGGEGRLTPKKPRTPNPSPQRGEGNKTVNQNAGGVRGWHTTPALGWYDQRPDYYSRSRESIQRTSSRRVSSLCSRYSWPRSLSGLKTTGNFISTSLVLVSAMAFSRGSLSPETMKKARRWLATLGRIGVLRTAPVVATPRKTSRALLPR